LEQLKRRSATTDTNKSNKTRPKYEDKWFSSKAMATVRRILKRWTEENVPNDKQICGNIYSHYFNYKISSVLHQTKRECNKNFFESYNRLGFYLPKQMFCTMFWEVMKQELLLNSEELAWVTPPPFMGQVKTANVKNICQFEFLHHFLTGVVSGTFPNKTFFDLT
jgi:hypothetical protein